MRLKFIDYLPSFETGEIDNIISLEHNRFSKNNIGKLKKFYRREILFFLPSCERIGVIKEKNNEQ